MAATEMSLDEHRDEAKMVRDRAWIRRWLYLVALMIFAMILVGGATRLTDSGLSITEWKPIHGAIPPLSDADWHEEFEKYKEIPEYQHVNKGMSLSEFKFIFWWEWGHRLLGRMIGVVVFVPLAWIWVSGRLEPWLKPRLAALFVMGGLQGAVGWWMVVSGLSERVDVSQYRLAAHLTFACLIFAYTIWLASCLTPWREKPLQKSAARLSAGLLFLAVLIQIYLGGLVAGLKAGLIYNTWPLIDGALWPAGLLASEPLWRNFFENHLTVQFVHRMAAYGVVLLAFWHMAATLRLGTRDGYSRRAALIVGLVIAQVALGVLTLIHVVPMSLALIHQGGAIVVLAVVTRQFQAASMGERAIDRH